ncbi:acyl-CoA thioesterase [Alkalihalobacterium alkalinitrilicum]|uniref:acyl-CoA thioesterase n=1 Tax=Alkalihalobacterium alkalinitrilicum TaxID=427920 RepID=UPI0009956FD7|nr:thioesterase family protein [Alkalihalobacterium alkalinitrilicum]
MTHSEYEVVVETKHSHLNNVELLGYMDEARFDWYMYCISLGVEALVVHMSTDFKKEVFNHDKILIRTWIERVGNTSIALQQKVVSEQNAHIASAQVILATVDRQTRQKVTVPQEVRDLLVQQGVLDLNLLKLNSSFSS